MSCRLIYLFNYEIIMSIFSKIYYYFSMLVIFVALFMMIYVIRLVEFDGNPPIVFEQSTNIEVVDKAYRAGDYVEVKSSGCLNTNAPSRVFYSLVDTQEYIMPALNLV